MGVRDGSGQSAATCPPDLFKMALRYFDLRDPVNQAPLSGIMDRFRHQLPRASDAIVSVQLVSHHIKLKNTRPAGSSFEALTKWEQEDFRLKKTSFPY